jgi:ArsR family transcriptional regulator
LSDKEFDPDLVSRAYELQAAICRVLADPKRLHIVHLLADGERSVGELTAALRLRQANVSQHLTLMRDRGIVAGRRDGRTVYYRLANPLILQACAIMHQVLLQQLTDREALSRQLHQQQVAVG